jgi:hypothetical protein
MWMEKSGKLNLSRLIHPSVLHSLCNVAGQNIFTAGKIGDGTRYFEHPMIGARR